MDVNNGDYLNHANRNLVINKSVSIVGSTPNVRKITNSPIARKPGKLYCVVEHW